MASINVIDWIQKNAKFIGTGVLEVGAKRYKEHAHLNLREFLAEKKPAAKLIGCDISAGDEVDVVLDITAPYPVITEQLKHDVFDTVFCVSVLEHIPDVFGACKNISNLLSSGGALFVSVPFTFRYHGYPGDYWRFTPEAVTYLFPDIDFVEYRHCTVTTLEQDDRMSLKANGLEKMNRFLFRPKSLEDKVVRKQAKQAGEEVQAYSLAPAMINMLGFKK